MIRKGKFLLTYSSWAVCLLLSSTAMLNAQTASLTGTYAETTNWGCTNFSPDAAEPNSTLQLTTSGRITYYDDGSAEGVGQVAISDHTNTAGDIGRYECTWAYVVIDNPDSDCNIAPNNFVGPIRCDFKYEGTCDVTTALNPTSRVVLDQVWYGLIGISKNDKTDKLKDENSVPDTSKGSADTILIERHDGNPERDSDSPNANFNICGKTGTQIKISETPVDLIID